jgi:hypothetical protein
MSHYQNSLSAAARSVFLRNGHARNYNCRGLAIAATTAAITATATAITAASAAITAAITATATAIAAASTTITATSATVTAASAAVTISAATTARSIVLETLGHRKQSLAAEAILAIILDLEQLHFDAITNIQHIGNVLDMLMGDLRDMQQSGLLRQDFNNRAKSLTYLHHTTVIDLALFRHLRQRANHIDSLL